jgi:kinesin family protein 6/9
MSETIEVYGRIRPLIIHPSKKRNRPKEIDYVIDEKKLHVRAPKSLGMGEGGKELLSSNSAERYQFSLSGTFDQSVTQDQIFDHVALKVVKNVLEGYNGTIFAYGQSGSGKTHTMTGGSNSYESRGVIPRAVSYIFDTIAGSPDMIYTVRISYIEVYKNNGYDLLDPGHSPQNIENLPKIVLHSDGDGTVTTSNVTSFPVASQEEALNHLFVGDTNRMICETANNDLSSRSHCM